MLNKLDFQLIQSDLQIKKEPLHLVFKTCHCCTRRFERWSDKADDIDDFNDIDVIDDIDDIDDTDDI